MIKLLVVIVCTCFSLTILSSCGEPPERNPTDSSQNTDTPQSTGNSQGYTIDTSSISTDTLNNIYLNTPKTLQTQLTTIFGSINIDASVSVPNAESAPVYTTKKARTLDVDKITQTYLGRTFSVEENYYYNRQNEPMIKDISHFYYHGYSLEVRNNPEVFNNLFMYNYSALSSCYKFESTEYISAAEVNTKLNGIITVDELQDLGNKEIERLREIFPEIEARLHGVYLREIKTQEQVVEELSSANEAQYDDAILKKDSIDGYEGALEKVKLGQIPKYSFYCIFSVTYGGVPMYINGTTVGDSDIMLTGEELVLWFNEDECFYINYSGIGENTEFENPSEQYITLESALEIISKSNGINVPGKSNQIITDITFGYIPFEPSDPREKIFDWLGVQSYSEQKNVPCWIFKADSEPLNWGAYTFVVNALTGEVYALNKSR